ncbi:exodeoxyribonuclease V alpha chain [Vibrio variabilis]|uniref:Exodeoxyribonuclease V alpha chain n=1 Tax=Vibrio variabilis TaxID=990271 RepID=A0ABQ0JMY1_9VIBR|nr:exodeoxyribonuclease V alpha chain [Vibrio variabilis]
MTTSRTFAQWIEDLVAKKCLRPLDYQFAKFVASIETQYPDEVMWLAALVSAQLGQGHICVNLDSDLTEQALMPSPDLIGLYGAAAVPLEDKVAKLIGR